MASSGAMVTERLQQVRTLCRRPTDGTTVQRQPATPTDARSHGETDRRARDGQDGSATSDAHASHATTSTRRSADEQPSWKPLPGGVGRHAADGAAAAGRPPPDRAARPTVPAPAEHPRHHGREPEGWRRQDDDDRQPGGGARAGRAERAGPRQRPAGQRVDRARHRAPRGDAVDLRGAGRRRADGRRGAGEPGRPEPVVPAGHDRPVRRGDRARLDGGAGDAAAERAGRLPRRAGRDRARSGSTTSSSTARPSLGLLTVNAFVVAREVLIPIQCEYYALEGLSQLLKTIQLIQAHLNPRAARVDDPADHVRRADQPGAAGGDRGARRTSRSARCARPSRGRSASRRRRATGRPS